MVAGLGGLLIQGAQSIDAESTPGEPYGVHLSYTQDPETTLTVMWFTEGLEDPGTTVEWGPAADQLVHSAEGTSQKVPNDDVLAHEVTMTGLTPGEPVFYRVGGDSGFTKVWKAEHYPAEGETLEIAHYADQDIDGFAPDVTQAVLEDDPDLVLIPGDLSYAEGDAEEWDQWFEMSEELLATRPMMATLGNHEAYGPHGTQPFIVRFAHPGAEYYYSFDYHNIHILALQSRTGDAQADGIFEEQIEFAHEDLRDAYERRENGEIDYIIVLQHDPLYSNREGLNEQFHVQRIAWQEHLFDTYQVDAIWVGDNHFYERSFPMMGSVPTTTEEHEYDDPTGWIQVISGGAGRTLYDFQHPDDFWPHTVDWARRHHYSKYVVDGTSMHHEAISSGLVPGDRLGWFNLTSQNAGGAEDADPVPTPGPVLAS